MTTFDYTKNTALPICPLCGMPGEKDERNGEYKGKVLTRTIYTHAVEKTFGMQSVTDWCCVVPEGSEYNGGRSTMANHLAKAV